MNRYSRYARAKVLRKRFVYGIRLSMVMAVMLLFVFLVMKRTARTTEAVHETRYKYYTSIEVRKGDSLWSIAERYITSEYEDMHEYIDEVIRMNGLRSTDIKAGSHLCVPYYSEEFK